MRIGVLCGGGDAGMNPCIRAIVRAAGLYRTKWSGFGTGIGNSRRGLFDGSGSLNVLGVREVSGLTSRGGTILHSSRYTEYATRRAWRVPPRPDRNAFDALIVIGGTAR